MSNGYKIPGRINSALVRVAENGTKKLAPKVLQRKSVLENKFFRIADQKKSDYQYTPWYIPASGFGFDDRFLQNVRLFGPTYS